MIYIAIYLTLLCPFVGTLSSGGSNCGVTSSRSRSFDVSSLIGLPSPANDKNSQQRSGSCSPPPPGPRLAPAPSHPSPNLSVGPPAPPPPPPAPPVAPASGGLYPFLLHPGLYQHLITGMNPMLLNAQLQALAASSANPLLGAWGATHPGLLQVQQAAATAERLRALAGVSGSGSAAGSSNAPPSPIVSSASLSSHRYSPYPIPSPPISSAASLSTTGSAFQSVKKLAGLEEARASTKSEVTASENLSRNSPELNSKNNKEESSNANSTTQASEDVNENKTENDSSDIKNMEKLVNGLNGTSASKFGISHNNNETSSSPPTQAPTPTTQQPQISA